MESAPAARTAGPAEGAQAGTTVLTREPSSPSPRQAPHDPSEPPDGMGNLSTFLAVGGPAVALIGGCYLMWAFGPWVLLGALVLAAIAAITTVRSLASRARRSRSSARAKQRSQRGSGGQRGGLFRSSRRGGNAGGSRRGGSNASNGAASNSGGTRRSNAGGGSAPQRKQRTPGGTGSSSGPSSLLKRGNSATPRPPKSSSSGRGGVTGGGSSSGGSAGGTRRGASGGRHRGGSSRGGSRLGDLLGRRSPSSAGRRPGATPGPSAGASTPTRKGSSPKGKAPSPSGKGKGPAAPKGKGPSTSKGKGGTKPKSPKMHTKKSPKKGTGTPKRSRALRTLKRKVSIRRAYRATRTGYRQATRASRRMARATRNYMSPLAARAYMSTGRALGWAQRHMYRLAHSTSGPNWLPWLAGRAAVTIGGLMTLGRKLGRNRRMQRWLLLHYAGTGLGSPVVALTKAAAKLTTTPRPASGTGPRVRPGSPITVAAPSSPTAHAGAPMSASHFDQVVESFNELVANYEPETVLEYDEWLKMFGPMYEAMAAACKIHADRMQSDYGLKGPVIDMFEQFGSAHSAMVDMSAEVVSTWRGEQEEDINRHEDPRPREADFWNVAK